MRSSACGGRRKRGAAWNPLCERDAYAYGERGDARRGGVGGGGGCGCGRVRGRDAPNSATSSSATSLYVVRTFCSTFSHTFIEKCRSPLSPACCGATARRSGSECARRGGGGGEGGRGRSGSAVVTGGRVFAHACAWRAPEGELVPRQTATPRRGVRARAALAGPSRAPACRRAHAACASSWRPARPRACPDALARAWPGASAPRPCPASGPAPGCSFHRRLPPTCVHGQGSTHRGTQLCRPAQGDRVGTRVLRGAGGGPWTSCG